MNKETYLRALAAHLAALPEEERRRTLDYYAEILSDLTDEGMSEEEAVASLGPIDQTAAQILASAGIPFSTPAPQSPPAPPRKPLTAGTIVLLALGSPIWGSLLLAALIVVLALYIVLWAVVISFWAVEIVFAVGGLAVICAPFPLLAGSPVQALLLLGMGLICVGMAILWYYAAKWTSIGAARLSALPFRAIKR